jgi:hypothetical protein
LAEHLVLFLFRKRIKGVDQLSGSIGHKEIIRVRTSEF